MKNQPSDTDNYFLAHWIDNGITDDELRNQVSDEDFMAYKKLRKGIELYSALEAPVSTTFELIKEKISGRNEAKTIKLGTGWIAAIAASVALFIVSYFIFVNGRSYMETGFGEQQTITLVDGSQVRLNARSSISYNSRRWKKERIITLDGEAFFDVVKGNKFTVDTKNGRVEVLGTQFNVNSSNNFFEVFCYEGKVQVIITDSTFVLLPGKGLRKMGNSDFVELQFESKSPEWLSGQPSFKDVPLKYVMDQLEKQFQVVFDRSNIDETLSFTGSFDNADLDLSLATVFKPMGISYKTTDKNKILLRPAK